MSGYILLSKGILNSEIWRKPPLYMKVWVYLLINANYKDHGNLKRGQLITSIPEIQRACSYRVGYRMMEPSKREIWGVLEFLRNPYEGNDEGNAKVPMIVTTKVTHGMMVTICKYNDYQSPKFYEGNNEGNDEGTPKELRRERQGNNIKNEYKEYKELIKESSSRKDNNNTRARAREGDHQPIVDNSFLSPDQMKTIRALYEKPDDLIRTVQESVGQVRFPMEAVIKYAKEARWPRRQHHG